MGETSPPSAEQQPSPPRCQRCGEPLVRARRIAATRPDRPARWRWDCPHDGSWASWTDDGLLFAACWRLSG